MVQIIVGAEYIVCTHCLIIVGAAAPTEPVVPTLMNVVTTLSKGCILVSLDCTLLQRRSHVANVANVISCLVVVIIRFVDVVWIRCHNVFP